MSMYCTISGSISYEKQEDFDKALSLLQVGGWLKDGFILDEMGTRISEEADVDISGRAIRIPLFHYRNLGGFLDKLFVGGKGEVIWTSTDGCFDGGFIIDGKEISYDLTKWAKENMPEEDADPPDENDFDSYCEWQQEVEQTFFEEMT